MKTGCLRYRTGLASDRQAESGLIATFTARKLPLTEAGAVVGFAPHLTSLSDYYPFGSGMKGRVVDGSYRYSFQGQETDAEYFNGAVSFKYRVHDARLGRFLSIDPLAPDYPWNSTYAFSENRVIDGVELEGLEYLNYWEARIRVNNFGAVSMDVTKFSDTFQDAWNKQLGRTRGKPVPAFSTNEFLASRNPELFQLIPEEVVTRPSILDDDMMKLEAEGNLRFKSNGSYDMRYNSSRRMMTMGRTAKGFMAIEALGLAFDAYQSWGAMFDSMDFRDDEDTLKKDLAALENALVAIGNYVSQNDVDPSLMSGNNAVNLVNYVLTGEMSGDDTSVFDLGDKVLESVGKNDGVKFKKPVSGEAE